MEIMKVFSDSYDEERIYSVLMNEEELALFSEIQKEFSNATNKALKKAWVKSQGGRQALRDRVGIEVGAVPGFWGVPGKNINRSINVRAMESGLGESASTRRLAEGSEIKINPKNPGKRFYDHENFAGNKRANKEIMGYFKSL